MSEALLLEATFWIDADSRTPGIACLTHAAPDVTLTTSEDC